MLETRRLCGALGAEVSGVDLSKHLDEETARCIVDAFHEHLVLVFRGQSLDPSAQIAFTRLFGEPQEHPLRTRTSVEGFPEVLIIETRPGRMGARNDYWHSDISHQERPPAASILHALSVPDALGDTMFCNMYRALDTLSPGLQRLLDGMEAMHSAEVTMRRAQEKGTDAFPIDSVPAVAAPSGAAYPSRHRPPRPVRESALHGVVRGNDAKRRACRSSTIWPSIRRARRTSTATAGRSGTC